MQPDSYPITKDLVLVGGGHSHAIALKMFGMKPIPGVRLTLITDTSHTPYSGMLPGYVAGFYSYDQAHIDLRRLAGFAKAQLYIDRVIGLDLNDNKVICTNHPPVAFDYLSIDIGSTPRTMSTPGAHKYAIAAKPVPKFLAAWERIVAGVTQNPRRPLSLGIVGGGAGGVELALNVQGKLDKLLHQRFTNAPQLSKNLQIHLFHRGNKLLPHHNSWVSNHLKKILLQRGIQLHLLERVSQISPNQLIANNNSDSAHLDPQLLPELLTVICDSGLKVECHHVFWVTQASAPSWIKTSGLTTDEQGFILVADTLQSISHPHIFAAGDIATMQNYQRPKAGVFAVRQGKPLFKNLQRIVLGKKLIPYIPQKRYLSLIGTGDKSAIASWSLFGWHSQWMWQRKDHIDRKFMSKFEDLPPMIEAKTIPIPSQQSPTHSTMPCAGCGSKVSSTTLERVIKRLSILERPDIVMGLRDPDDAAVVQVPEGQLMVQTIDYFRSLIDDPYIFSQIATNHCLSDIFAMGATPQSALAVVTIPYGREDKVEETLYQVMSGANKILQECQTSLIGGHTTEGAELAFGLSCNGLVHPEKLLRKSGMKPGQVLILTKAIGTGTLFAANMRYQAKGRWIEQAVESMLLSNQTSAQVFRECGATACTDITGFGLLGHLLEMVNASNVSVELELAAIPILPGAIETVQAGITSSIHPKNLRSSIYIKNRLDVSHLPNYQLLFDPQTSGGLLAAIPAEKADECINNLKACGHKQSCLIGRVIPAPEAMSRGITII
ncbi:MAG: selenide, water dikinase SelD [Moorea sp. SIO4A3]|nr:selenide, water dikinase SelD [Moorena sp. SIO4A3]